MVGSANPYRGNIYASWNDNHTIVGNRTIYNSLIKYFYDLKKDKTEPQLLPLGRGGKYKLYFFPRKRGVFVLDVLRSVRCKGVRKGSGSRRTHRDPGRSVGLDRTARRHRSAALAAAGPEAARWKC